MEVDFPKTCNLFSATLFVADVPALAVQDDDVFNCTDCLSSFRSQQMLSTHRYNVHNYVNPMRLRVYSTACVRCETEFHSKERMFHHIDGRGGRSNDCSTYYLESVDPMSHEAYVEQRRVDRKLSDKNKSTKALLVPPVKIVLI